MQPAFVNQYGQQCDAQGNPISPHGAVMMAPVMSPVSPVAPQMVNQYGQPCDAQGNPLSPAVSPHQPVAPQMVNQYGQPCDAQGNPLQPATATSPQNVVVNVSPNYVPVPNSPQSPQNPPPQQNPAPTPKQNPPPATSPKSTSSDAPYVPVKRDFTFTEKFKLFVGLAAALVGMILGIVGYAAWNEKTSDFNGVISNWQATPIVDVQFMVGSCPSGYTAEPLAHVSYTFTETTTTTNSDGSTSSSTKTSTRVADLNGWRADNNFLCTLRSGVNALNRVRYTSDSPCPSGMKACGQQDCVDSAATCPMNTWDVISSTQSSSSSTTDTAGATTKVIPMEPNSNSVALQARSNIAGGMPIVELQVRQGRPCLGQALGSSAESGKVCSNSIAIPSTGLPAGAPSKDASNEDNRYIPIDNVDESTYFGFNSGAPTEIVRFGMPWYLSYRNEIAWSTSCPQTRQSVVDVKSRVNAISAAQLVLLIFSIFVGLFSLYSFAVIYNEWKKGDSIEADKKQSRQDKCGMVVDAILIVPNIVAIALASQSKSFFESLKDSNCSDDTTSTTFRFLGTEVSKIAGINIAKFVLLTLFLAYKLIQWYRAPKGLTAPPPTPKA